MAKSKIIYNNETLIDLSEDSVTPEKLAKGVTAHNANGDPIVGTGINADTVDGLHVAVRSTAPPSGTTSTVTFIYKAGG